MSKKISIKKVCAFGRSPLFLVIENKGVISEIQIFEDQANDIIAALKLKRTAETKITQTFS